MKNLILTIAILVTGVINAQSFEKVIDLMYLDPELLSLLGFEEQTKKDSVYFKTWELNQVADLWINPTTGEIIKMSENATEYVYEDSVRIHTQKWPVNTYKNISCCLVNSLGIFQKYRYIEKEDMELSEAGGILKTFRKTCLWRTLKAKNEDDSVKISFVVLY
jgi:hypothetical protein